MNDDVESQFRYQELRDDIKGKNSSNCCSSLFDCIFCCFIQDENKKQDEKINKVYIY
jgi:hypothetical protein